MRFPLICSRLLPILLVCSAIGVQGSSPYTFTAISYPGSPRTGPFAINDSGQIVGTYYDVGGSTFHGFVLSGGTYTSLDFPGAVATDANGINSAGQIVGSYYTCLIPNGYGCRHPYVYSGGVFTAIPEAPAAMSGTTAAWSINASGQIAGYYVDPCFCKAHGFVYSGGTYQTIDSPGFYSTQVTGINDSGTVAGFGATEWGGGAAEGFILKSGVFTPIVVGIPGAQTLPFGINNAEDLAGIYATDDYHAFVYSGGSFTLFDHPATTTRTMIWGGLNSTRQVVGSYDADGAGHGFLGTPAVFDTLAPLVSAVSVIPNPVPINTVASLSASIDDSATGGSIIASGKYTIDSGTPTPMVLSTASSPTAQASAVLPPFVEANVYKVCVQGTDVVGNVSGDFCVFAPVYDPAGGFVTGGGQVASPAAADLLNPTAIGPATFGFVAKYLPGRNAPSGNLEFQFKRGSLNFKSTSIDWLVVTGEPRARFRGTGTVNGSDVCKFEVDAWDGSSKGSDAFGLTISGCTSGADRYRLPATPLANGSVVIHK